MKAVVLLALLGVAAANMSEDKETTASEYEKMTPGSFAYHYPVFGDFPVSGFPYASPYTYTFVVTNPVPATETVRAAKALGHSSGSSGTGSGSTAPRAKRSAYPDSEANPQTFYTSFVPSPTTYKFPAIPSVYVPGATTYKFPAIPSVTVPGATTYKFPAIPSVSVPGATTYNLPAAPFPFASPYTRAFPSTYPFVVGIPAPAKETPSEKSPRTKRAADEEYKFFPVVLTDYNARPLARLGVKKLGDQDSYSSKKVGDRDSYSSFTSIYRYAQPYQ